MARWLAEQLVMGVLVSVMTLVVLVCELIRVVVVMGRSLVPKKTGGAAHWHKIVLVDGECMACNALRSFVVYRMTKWNAEGVQFVSAQEVIRNLDRLDDTTRALTSVYQSHEAVAEHLLVRLHAVVEANGKRDVITGPDVVLGLLADCDTPYPLVASAAARWCPRFVVSWLYDVFSRNRHAWFGRSGSGLTAWMLGIRGATNVDDAARLKYAFDEATFFTALTFGCLTVAVLPNGNGHKDGPIQHVTRLICALLMTLALCSERAAAIANEDEPRERSFARLFFDKFVGYASKRSLAIMRAVCAVILLIFTTPMMTAPLAETALVPRFMCKPTGVLRLLGDAAPSIFGKDSLLASEIRLGALQSATRILLSLVLVGLATPIVAPLAAFSWLVYGGVLRSYNSWRGHSFIAAWWALVVLAWRGGAGDVWSVDALLRRRDKGSPRGQRADAAYRGWTRFMVTLVLANNYFMAGLSKFCASGVAWAFGSNLKAKLLQTSLTQGSFGVYLSLAMRHAPLPAWQFLGACGLYGELIMGLVPFKPIAKLCFPALMWAMHLGIILLQHIVFVDLLTMIPAWYAWHAIDLLEQGGAVDYAGGPWDWRRIYRESREALGLQPAPVYAIAPPNSDNDIEDDSDTATIRKVNDELELEHVSRHSSMRALGFVACFVAVWAQGAEWYPWNAFRMFADWTPNPVSYERYVALDAQRRHLRNFHMHEINPVLNRKRFIDALELCATKPRDQDCIDFISFVNPIAKALPANPAFLIVQERNWDFEKQIDQPDFCDYMNTYEYDVHSAVVSKGLNQPCDPIDWHLCCTRTIGTI